MQVAKTRIPICIMRIIILLTSIYSYVWALSLGILLAIEGYEKCPIPAVCHRNDSVRDRLNVTNWLISAGGQFAASKTVRSLDGNIMVLASISPYQRPSTNRDDTPFSLCSMVCKTFLSSHTIYVQSVLNVTHTKQANFDAIFRHDSMENVMRGIRSILNHVKWRTLVVITSSYQVLTAQSGGRLASIKLLLYMIDDPTNPLESIDLASIYELLPEEERNLLLVCPSDCIQKILNQARWMESNTTMTETLGGSKWLVIPSNGSVKDFTYSRESFKTDGVVFLDLMPCSRYYSPLWGSARDSVVQAKIHMLRKSHTETKIETAGYIGHDDSVQVHHQLYHVGSYGYRNRTLIVGTLEWAPFVVKRVENGSVRFDGLCIQLLQELAKQLNFSYRLVEPKDKEWGRILNGSWTGLVKLLSNGEVDMIVAPMTMTESRATVIDFTVPYFYANSALILSKQDPHKWLTLLYLFRHEVLLCILVSLIFSTVFLFLIEEVTPVRSGADDRPTEMLSRYGNILWYHFGALMANGGPYLPKTESGRTVVSCWWLFTVIMAATYSGNLIAFLTDGRQKPPFSSLDEMVQQDTYKWGFVGGTSLVTLFQESNISVYQSVWQRAEKLATNNPDWLSQDGDKHLRRAAESHYIYIAEETPLMMWDDPRRCHLEMLSEKFRPIQYAVGLPKNSEHSHDFSQQILKVFESGLLELWWNRLKPKHQCEPPSRKAKRVDFLALQSAFYGAVVGVAMALLVLVFEVIKKRRKQAQQRKSKIDEEESMRSVTSSQEPSYPDIPSST
ncbi:glutamate receptor ionotropic, kainate 5-like [Haliotis asinina]|uniref:glutamate receptor ionotropic, kainate 5-like n=1 Tax=Haliotis asinina TaxID=109174 RepID=UPI003532440B